MGTGSEHPASHSVNTTLYLWIAPGHPLYAKVAYAIRILARALSLRTQIVEKPELAPTDRLLVTYGECVDLSVRRPTLIIEPALAASGYFARRIPFDPTDIHYWPSGIGEVPLLFASERCANAHWLPDIAASAFFFLSRWEEAVIPDRDPYGRFRFADSLIATLHGYPAPIVDQYLLLFEDAIRHLAKKTSVSLPYRRRWPNGHRFAVALTHDVDHLTKWRSGNTVAELKRGIKQVLRHKRAGASVWRLAANLSSWLRKANPYLCGIQTAITLEQQANAQSTFFVMSNESHPMDGSYCLKDPVTRQALTHIENAHCEIGWHAGFGSYDDPDVQHRQLSHLRDLAGEFIISARPHYLRLDTQGTYAAYERLGIKYSSSAGYSEIPGYRAGFSFPYRPYCIAEDRPFGIWEVPLVVMDTTLEHPNYLGLTAQQAWPHVEECLQYAAEQQSCCTLLWHNTSFDEINYPSYAGLYERTLKWIEDHDGWAAPVGDIVRWWAGET